MDLIATISINDTPNFYIILGVITLCAAMLNVAAPLVYNEYNHKKKIF